MSRTCLVNVGGKNTTLLGASAFQPLDTGAICKIFSVVAMSDAATGGTEENTIVLSPTILTDLCPGERNSIKLGDRINANDTNLFVMKLNLRLSLKSNKPANSDK